MKWIYKNDLKVWADTRNCQENLPHLVQKLIRATCQTIRFIKFPSGDNVQTGGYDGELETTEGTEYIPKGKSVWEFGVTEDCKGKADGDYDKRSKNSLGYTQSETTFVFVTPRLWTKGIDWVKEKNKDEGKVWKEVKVINSELLEEWLEQAPTVAKWLAVTHLKKYPEVGIQDTERFWEEWITGPEMELNPQILIAGRSKEVNKLVERIKTPAIIPVQGISREEVLAFIIACFKNHSEQAKDFFARSLIVDSVEVFRQLVNQKDPLILIPRFDDASVMHLAVKEGHTVIVPLSADSSNNWDDKIILSIPDREEFIAGLGLAGVPKELAEKYSKESARSISVLRRQLRFDSSLPKWATPQNIRIMVPALLVGKWNEEMSGDRNIIAQLAKETYDGYVEKLTLLLSISDAPLFRIGSEWRLVSPYDAWNNIGKHLTNHDFELLANTFQQITQEIKNPLKNPSKGISFNTQPEMYSSWIREGICQSLAIIGIFSKEFNLAQNQTWVDRVVYTTLNTDDMLFWKSVNQQLPLIAEASPTEFIRLLEEKVLTLPNAPALFEEREGFITAHTDYTGLLWALEGLAWIPEHLPKVTLILARLSALDPGGTLQNRPFNSLKEIFNTWYYQTFANLEERTKALELLTKKEKEIAWRLLIAILPDQHTWATQTHRLRWRMFKEHTTPNITYQEILKTCTVITDLFLRIFDYSEDKLSELIDTSTKLPVLAREKVLVFTTEASKNIQQTDYKAWHTVKNLLTKHQAYPNADWAFSEQDLEPYQQLYEVLMPTNEIEKVSWMFDTTWFTVAESGKMSTKSEKLAELQLNKRIEGLEKIYNVYGNGIEEIKKLSQIVQHPDILGNTLGHLAVSDDDILKVCKLLKDDTNLPFVLSFMHTLSLKNQPNWIIEWYKKLQKKRFTNLSLGWLLTAANPTNDLWDFLYQTPTKTQDGYWSKRYPNFWGLSVEEKMRGIRYLLQYKRLGSAFFACYFDNKVLPTGIIIEVLKRGATEQSNDIYQPDNYRVCSLFTELDTRNDWDIGTILQLEQLYVGILNQRYSTRKPKYLHQMLVQEPESFVDVLRFLKEGDDELKKKPIEEQRDRWFQVHQLLDNWDTIPGVDEEGHIDSHYLADWVEQTRNLARHHNCLNLADCFIGKILAKYPEKEAIVNWPPDEICEIIENIGNDSIIGGFSTAIFNKRGFSTRGTYDGGTRERKLADYFKKLADQKYFFPKVADVFIRLARGYEEKDAPMHDNEATKRTLDW